MSSSVHQSMLCGQPNTSRICKGLWAYGLTGLRAYGLMGLWAYGLILGLRAYGLIGWLADFGLLGLRLTADGCRLTYLLFSCVKVVKLEKKRENQALEWSWTSLCEAVDPLSSLWKWIFMDFHWLYSIFTSSSVTSSRQPLVKSIKINKNH